MNHCNQPNIPILSKFRGDESLQKYNGHGNSSSNIGSSHYQPNVPYTPSSHLHSSSDDKQRLSNSYQQPNASNLQLHQSQPEITQDICNALLNQQDTKRGTQSFWMNEQHHSISKIIIVLLMHCLSFRLAIIGTKLSRC